jgi:hypothetical protein
MRKLLIILFGVMFVFAGADAFAKKAAKKKKKGKSKQPKEITVAPQSDEIAPMIEGFTWGMSKDEVLKVLGGKVKAEYKEKMIKAKDPIKEDKLHQELQKKIKALKKSYVEFEGQITGYDSSLVKIEYTHKNNEAMLVFPKDMKTDRKWDDYFFFINNRLWKIFRAYDADMFPGLTWGDVQSAMGTKFGPKPLKVKKFDPDTKYVQTIGLSWQDKETLMTLLNYTTFYGIFCLRFEDKETGAEIDTLRVNKPPAEKQESIVDAITEGTSKDEAHDIVDQLTKGQKKKKSSGSGSLPAPKKKDESSILDDI